MPTPDKRPVLKPRRRILVMRYRFIGDTLLTVPFLRNLRAAYPDAIIDMLAAPHSGEVLRDCPYIDELLMFDTTRKHRYENPNNPVEKRSFWSYVSLLRSRQYDTAFVLKRSFSSAGLAFLAGIPERIGFNTEGRGFLLTQGVPYRVGIHEVDCFLEVLETVGVPVQDRHLESWWQPQESQKAEQLLASLSKVSEQSLQHVVLHLTSSNVAKQWPLSHAVQLAQWLLLNPNRHLHALGAPADKALYEELLQLLPEDSRSRVHIHCGALSLLESMAFLKRMDLVVGVDSGTLHMASAAGVPVVALFGPMDERKWGPMNASIVTEPMSCRPCHLAKPCQYDFRCMKDLRPEAVIETIKAYAGFS